MKKETIYNWISIATKVAVIAALIFLFLNVKDIMEEQNKFFNDYKEQTKSIDSLIQQNQPIKDSINSKLNQIDATIKGVQIQRQDRNFYYEKERNFIDNSDANQLVQFFTTY